MPEVLQQLLVIAVRVMEVVGAAVIIAGAAIAAIGYIRRRIGGATAEADFRQFRSGLGRSILIGLEFLIAGDIIRTVTTELSVESLLSLGLLIVLRTLLSLTLEVEIEGRWPWARWRGEDRRER